MSCISIIGITWAHSSTYEMSGDPIHTEKPLPWMMSPLQSKTDRVMIANEQLTYINM